MFGLSARHSGRGSVDPGRGLARGRRDRRVEDPFAGRGLQRRHGWRKVVLPEHLDRGGWGLERGAVVRVHPATMLVGHVGSYEPVRAIGDVARMQRPVPGIMDPGMPVLDGVAGGGAMGGARVVVTLGAGPGADLVVSGHQVHPEEPSLADGRQSENEPVRQQQREQADPPGKRIRPASRSPEPAVNLSGGMSVPGEAPEPGFRCSTGTRTSHGGQQALVLSRGTWWCPVGHSRSH